MKKNGIFRKDIGCRIYQKVWSKVEMKKKFMDEFVNKCEKGVVEAKRAVQELSDDEIIELRAEMKAKIVHLDKWVELFLPFLALIVSAVALFGNMMDADKNTIVFVAVILSGFIALIVAAINRLKKGNIERAQSYLEDYSKKEQKVQMQEVFTIETFEEISNRQKKERELVLAEWKRKRTYINEQISLFESSLAMIKENNK